MFHFYFNCLSLKIREIGGESRIEQYQIQNVVLDAPRMDEVDWVRYKTKLHKKSARDHIVAVTHTKAQNVIGKGTLGVIFFD